MRQYLIVFAVLCVSVPAAAETAVIANNSGRECYVQMLREPTPENNRLALSACYLAVHDAGDGDDIYNHAASLANLAAVHLRMKNYADVVTNAQKAIVIFPTMAQAYANLGAGLLGLERYNESLSALDKAIDLNADDLEEAYFNRALVKEHLGDMLGAFSDCYKASKINPKFQPAVEEMARFRFVTTRS